MQLINIRGLYTQGQYNGKIREYFYYVSHNGFLFLDDSRMKNFTAAYKDVPFLNFFYSKLKENKTKRYQEHFPWVSLCGIERNYLRCDDTPLVYTELDPAEKSLRIGQSTLSHPFKPESLSMTSNGRVYHHSLIGGKALVADKLTDKLFKRFQFDESGNPIAFKYGNEYVKLSN
uniref:DKNYY family protein n=1 Tax=Caenorhabditis tropicalis TaxID=1561998 RepID=A0A1I7T8P8_9PELO